MSAFSLQLKNDLDEIETLMDQLNVYANEHDLNETVSFRLSLILDELVSNTISYGYADGRQGRIDIRMHQTGRHIEVLLKDDGDAFNPLEDSEVPDIDADIDDRDIGGLGVHFVREFSEKVAYQRLGLENTLTLSIRLTDE